MPNIGVALKDEIVRLSRKTQKSSLTVLQRASADHRRQIAQLKRQITTLQRELARLNKGSAKARPEVDAEDPSGAAHRFQVRGLKSLRARLGLNAEDFGKLVGVSGQSIYNWEHEKAAPRASQVAALALLRGVGKREALKRLGASQTTEPKAKASKPAAPRKKK